MLAEYRIYMLAYLNLAHFRMRTNKRALKHSEMGSGFQPPKSLYDVLMYTESDSKQLESENCTHSLQGPRLEITTTGSSSTEQQRKRVYSNTHVSIALILRYIPKPTHELSVNYLRQQSQFTFHMFFAVKRNASEHQP